jgi:hypothetical protein
VYPGLGDLDGDGRLELVAVGDGPTAEGMLVRVFDAATGAVAWELPIEGSGQVGSAVTADVDGDDRDECLFSFGPLLYSVGTAIEGDAGAIQWKLAFPAGVGPLALADTVGDGTLEIIAPCADGYVYGVGGE